MSKEKEEQKALEIKAEVAHGLHKRILELKENTAMNFLEFGRIFSKIQDEKHYVTLGCETFEEYLGQPEVGFDRSTVFAFTKIYRLYVEQKKIPMGQLSKIHWSKLNMIAPVITDKNCEDLLEQASTLSRSDLRKEVEVLKSKPGHLLSKSELDGKEDVLDEIKRNCPVNRGSVCPFIKKYPNDVVRDYLDKKK